MKVWIAHHGEAPYVCEHCGRRIEKITGRTKGCGVIHHKDEDRSNNDISNLAAMHRECHMSHHQKGKPKLNPRTGWKHSPETREKLRQAALRREARKREVTKGVEQ